MGLRLAAAGEYLSTVATGTGPSSDEALVAVEAGATTWIDEEGDEVSLRARYAPPAKGLVFFGGFRKFAGRDEWKTFIEADLALTAMPGWFFGARIAAGLQWDPARPFGAYASAGVAGEMGVAFRFRFEVAVGLHVRFDIAPP